MRFFSVAPILIGTIASLNAGTGPEISRLRRLYDFTPVSATNPVIASVPECGIEIPASELRAYVRSTVAVDAAVAAKPLDVADKKRLLDELVNEHFLLWDGYRKNADQTPGMIALLQSTEAMLLQETLTQQEAGDKAKTPAEYERLSKKLNDELFKQADITVSVEAYDDLKAALRRMKQDTGAGAGQSTNAGPASTGTGTLPPGVRNRPLARCRAGTVTIADVFNAYVRLPAEKRPDLMRQDGLTRMLKTLLEEALLVDAARARGLEHAPIVLEKMQENRNTLTRLYALDRLREKAVARMQEPGTAARIREWYEANRKTRYTYTNDLRQPQVLSFEENFESIENDYFELLNEQMRAEYVRSLRQGRVMQIDEPLLDQLTLFPSVSTPAELSSSVVTWDSDTRTHVVAAGETNAVFHFQFTNTSAEEITLFQITPSCECTTVHSPPLPWKLASGGKGEFDAHVDLRNKTNSYTRTLQIESSRGGKTLTLNIVVPAAGAPGADAHDVR